MAEKMFVNNRLEVLALSRKEAADLAALLIGQLADVPVQGNQAGAAPAINIVEDGQIVRQMGFVLKPD